MGFVNTSKKKPSGPEAALRERDVLSLEGGLRPRNASPFQVRLQALQRLWLQTMVHGGQLWSLTSWWGRGQASLCGSPGAAHPSPHSGARVTVWGLHPCLPLGHSSCHCHAPDMGPQPVPTCQGLLLGTP